MFDDLLDDPQFRSALETSLGIRARALGGAGWAFERSRFGLRQWELAPLGLYSAVGVELGPVIDDAPRRASRVTIHVNPLDPRADESARHASARGYRVVTRQTHILPIGTSIESMRRDFHATKRYEALRKVDAASSIVVADQQAQLQDYFAVYEASLARWGRQEFLYPRSLFNALLGCDSVRIWMNYVAGRLACAMVVFYCRRYAFYWQGVSRVDEDQKRAYPVVKLMDAVLQDLVQSGIGHLNLGASDGLPKVRAFKESFGAGPATYPTLVHESVPWRVLVAGRQLWRRAPG
jgi:hypothetical protein